MPRTGKDTKKHVLLFPEDPTEAFEMAAQAFDPRRPTADHDRCVMLDLDIGMNPPVVPAR